MKKLLSSLMIMTSVSTLLLADNTQDIQEIKATLENNAKSGFQLAGYAAFDYSTSEDGTESSGVKFSPIFHYQYSQIMQFEGELEITTTETGETEIDLEYASATLFLNDYMGLQVGKFMSPVGQFVQNQHPSWVNKMPDAPLGFGHDGAATTSNVGVALRGGLPKIGSMRHNYALFVTNAPIYGLAADGDTIIEAIGTTTFGDVNANVGGRYAINPVGKMEIGVSGSLGEAGETLDSNVTIARSYSSFGVDFMYNLAGLDMKAEYIQQEVGENTLSPLEGGTWKTYYAQLSYQFFSKIEPVIRYSAYDNPEVQRTQVAMGLNYLFANNIIAKIAYQINDAQSAEAAVQAKAQANKTLVQLAFGF